MERHSLVLKNGAWIRLRLKEVIVLDTRGRPSAIQYVFEAIVKGAGIKQVDVIVDVDNDIINEDPE